MAAISPELMDVLNSLRVASERNIHTITQVVYELERAGVLDDDAIGRIGATFKGAKPSHPDVPPN